MRVDGQIDFVEFPGQDLLGMRGFYRRAFGWRFEEKDPGYVAFHGRGAKGGFCADPARAPAEPLVVFYAVDLEAVRARVIAAGGEITRDIFACPGGRRFQFRDPGENEVAVWSDISPGPEPEPEAAAAAIEARRPLLSSVRWATPLMWAARRQAVDRHVRSA